MLQVIILKFRSEVEKKSCALWLYHTQAMRCLIVTHNFPRWDGDISGNFIFELVSRFTRTDVNVLAPWSRGADVTTQYRLPSSKRLKVNRFKYGAPPLPEIAYRGNMQKVILRSPLHLTSFASFSISMTAAAARLSRWADVINAHWLIPGGFSASLGSIYHKKPMVITMHGTDSVLFMKFRRYLRFDLPIFRNLKAITVVSSFIADTVRPFVPPHVRIEVIPMPVNEKAFRPELRKSVKQEFDIIYVGRLTAQKNLSNLLKAIAILKDRFKLEARALIVGDGPELHNLKELARNYGIGELAHFAGSVSPSQVPNQMARARVIAMLSVREGFGMSILEGMRMGLPQVASNDGGMKDIVLDGATGYLVPPDDAGSAAAAIYKILSDPVLYQKMSRLSTKRAEEVFSSEKLARKFEDVLLWAAKTVK